MDFSFLFIRVFFNIDKTIMIINIKKCLQEHTRQDIILIVTITFKNINTY